MITQGEPGKLSVEAFVIERLLSSEIDKESRKMLEKLQTKYKSTSYEAFRNVVSDNLYFAVGDVARGWIEQDQKRLESQINVQQLEIDCELIRKLNIDIRYDIIEFIPTTSRWKSLERKFKDLNSCPIWLNKVLEEGGYCTDIPMVNYHKMRVISKEFNRRMMIKILSMEELVLVSGDKNYLKRILYLLKQQEFYKTNTLQDNELYLYQNDDCSSKIIPKHLFQDGVPIFSGKLERDTKDVDERYYLDDGFFFHAPPPPIPISKNLLDYNYTKLVFRSSPVLQKNNSINEFEGNTIVKHLVLLDPSANFITKHCKKVEKVTLFGDSEQLLETVNELEIITNTKEEDILMKKYKCNTFKFPNSTGNGMKKYLSLMSKKFGSKFIDYMMSCIPNSFDFTKLMDSPYRSDLFLMKEILDILVIDIQLPIAGLALNGLEVSNPEVFQYLIYLSNTYQNGKLFLNEESERLIYFGMFNGWRFEANLEELLFCTLSDEVFLTVLYSIGKISRDLCLSLVKYYYSSCNYIYLEKLVLYLLKTQKDEFMQLWYEKIQCLPKNFEIYSEFVHVPLLVIIISQTSPFTIDIIFKELDNQDLSLYEENEFGDNFLHYIQLALYNHKISSYPITGLLKKVPFLLGKENKAGVTPFDLIKHNSYSVFTEFVTEEYGEFFRDTRRLLRSKRSSTTDIPDDSVAQIVVIVS
ncbi:predicted protein [Naegleria gruberi]|uniref:Predicted protein n=1 Tax=Naegleria gruberi TaxID=5762 RepID=D2VEG8_NAEGR|nr:uncharacterized protein NAEGRDRAFT_48893 [Naegleria gruberi]EFC44875.1 predicted protein [Naegleria gruberi]|eukprot:XP_002677619.1 predicted protein [Naegleria gruberi strain NEG-M]